MDIHCISTITDFPVFRERLRCVSYKESELSYTVCPLAESLHEHSCCELSFITQLQRCDLLSHKLFHADLEKATQQLVTTQCGSTITREEPQPKPAWLQPPIEMCLHKLYFYHQPAPQMHPYFHQLQCSCVCQFYPWSENKDVIPLHL